MKSVIIINGATSTEQVKNISFSNEIAPKAPVTPKKKYFLEYNGTKEKACDFLNSVTVSVTLDDLVAVAETEINKIPTTKSEKIIVVMDQKFNKWNDLRPFVKNLNKDIIFVKIQNNGILQAHNLIDWGKKLGFYLRFDGTYNWQADAYRDVNSIEDMDPEFIKFITKEIGDGRYELNENESKVRATRGWGKALIDAGVDISCCSTRVAKAKDLPDIVYHGTHAFAFSSIMKNGLLPMSRAMVHTQTDIDKAKSVGQRHCGQKGDMPIIISIDIKEMFRDNQEIWKSHDGISYFMKKVDSKYFIMNSNVLSL